MITEEMYDKINKFFEDLDSNYDINAGGCCFIAGVVASWCEHNRVPYQAIMDDDCGCYDEDLFYDCIRGDERCDCTGLFEETCAHYYIRIDGHDINSGHWTMNPIELPEWVCAEDLFWIYETGKWNPDYNTDNNDILPDIIHKFLDEMFQKR